MAQEGLPQTAIEVCSRAMVMLGLRPMTSFSEVGRDEVIVASSLYEVVLAEQMASYPWKFCSGQQLLELDSSDPLDRYESAWHIPTLPTGQPHQIQTIRVADTPIGYEIMGRRIYCNASDTDEVIAHYQYRVEEPYWPPGFTLSMIFKMAYVLAIAITRKDAQIKGMAMSYDSQLRMAKTRDSQSVTTKRLRQDGFSRFRRGGGGGQYVRGTTS